MRRDVQEGQARCLSQLGRHEEALDIAEKMVTPTIFLVCFEHKNVAGSPFIWTVFWKNNLHVCNPSGCLECLGSRG